MILIFIFGLIFLIGFSLFVATLGTSFLKKYAKRVSKTGKPILKEIDYRKRFRKEYEKQISEITPKEVEKETTGEYAIPEGKRYGLEEAAEKSQAGKWVLFSLGILIVLIISVSFGYKQYQNISARPRLFFCENVDYVKLKPIHRSNTFTRGNVTLFVKSRKTLDADKARVDVYKIDPQGPRHFSSEKIPLKPEWASFSMKILFDRIGKYSVVVSTDDGTIIDRKNIFIVPDSYAFKPISSR